jgi:hypothetical protein
MSTHEIKNYVKAKSTVRIKKKKFEANNNILKAIKLMLINSLI